VVVLLHQEDRKGMMMMMMMIDERMCGCGSLNGRGICAVCL